MSRIQSLKAAHMADADARWERAVEKAREHFQSTDPQVRKLANLFLKASGQSRYYLFGLNGEEGLNGLLCAGQISTDSPCELLEILHHFISYELMDDGDPGLAFMRYGFYADPEGPEKFDITMRPCLQGDEGAQPYFYNRVEVLRKTQPGAKLLNMDDAIWAFEWYEARRLKKLAEAEDEDREAHVLDAFDVAMGELADELSAACGETP